MTAVDAIKDLVNKNETAQNDLKQENVKLMKAISDLNDKIECQQTVIDKALSERENRCVEVIKDKIEENTKNIVKIVEKSIKELRVELRTKVENTNSVKNVNMDQKENGSNNPKKTRLSKSKIKELKEAKSLEAFENDCKIFGELRSNCGLDVTFKTCRKCDFESHSEFLLRLHKERDHNIKQTFQNLVLGYEYDLQYHIEVLKPMDEPIETLKCSECDYITCTEGKIMIHKTEQHEELFFTYQG